MTLADHLDWGAPLTAPVTFAAWTAPLSGAFVLLAALRGRQRGGDGRGALAAAAIAADTAQRANRSLTPFADSSAGELQATFAASAVWSCAVNGIWLYGFLPPLVTSFSGIVSVCTPQSVPP